MANITYIRYQEAKALNEKFLEIKRKDSLKYRKKREISIKLRMEILSKKFEAEHKSNKEKLQLELKVLKTKHENDRDK